MIRLTYQATKRAIIAKCRFRFCSRLTAISPLDGRYHKSVQQLSGHFSQLALMKYRTLIQTEWLIHLIQNKVIQPQSQQSFQSVSDHLRKLYKNFSIQHGKRVKEIQSVTNHDLKSIEYLIKQNLTHHQYYKQFIHFCCTSEDINNLSYALMLKQSLNSSIFPKIDKICQALIEKSEKWSTHAMMARTHGQPATPTTLGKQYSNFAYRIGKQLKYMKNVRISGKMNGAVGNYNAHYFAYPNIDWYALAKSFIQKKLQLQFNPYTTQIQSHDSLARIFGQISLGNTIMIGLCRDSWEYTSKQYLKQKPKQGQIGSSTMPHKVNPIDFQNCEGNLGMANGLFDHLRNKLPISRLQRDLSDSTVLRNQGSGLAYSLMGYQSLLKGLSKVESNQQVMIGDLQNHYEIVTQAIQTQLRKVGYPQPYELLKKLSRGKSFTKQSLQKLSKQLQGKISKQSQQKIRLLHPSTYLGIAQRLAKDVSKRIKQY